MAHIIERIRPGDIISSDLFNRITATLEALDQRISALEDSGINPVLITQFEPVGELEIGQQLTILGRNFATPHQNNVVSIDGVTVTEFGIGNTSLRLRVIIPQLGGTITASGRNVIVRVSNDNGAGQLAYRILPEIPVTGNEPSIIAVADETTGSTNLTIGQLARVTGSNFSSTEGENILRFLLDIGGETNITPVVDIQSASGEEIIFVVPDISQLPGGFNFPTTLELTVGNFPIVRFDNAVPVRR